MVYGCWMEVVTGEVMKGGEASPGNRVADYGPTSESGGAV